MDDVWSRPSVEKVTSDQRSVSVFIQVQFDQGQVS